MRVALVIGVLWLAFGLVGGLIGYGNDGTGQAFCKGFGYGMLAPLLLLLVGGGSVSVEAEKPRTDD